MSRGNILWAKQEQIRRNLEQWAQESKILKEGEFLFFSMDIGKIGDCVLFTSHTPSSKLGSATTELQEADWEHLLKFQWKHDFQRRIILFLKERANKLTEWIEIETVLKINIKELMGNNFTSSMQSALKKCSVGHPYRYWWGGKSGASSLARDSFVHIVKAPQET